jgi:hypothetical protein
MKRLHWRGILLFLEAIAFSVVVPGAVAFWIPQDLLGLWGPGDADNVVAVGVAGRVDLPSGASQLFRSRPRLLRLSLGGPLEALQGILHAGGDSFRAKFLEEPAPPAWWEDEVSVVLDAAAGRVDGRAGDVWFLLQSEGEENMHGKLVSDGIDRFDLESEAQAQASEVDGLADGSRSFRLQPLNADTPPLEIAFPFCEVRPDDLHRGGDNGDGTNAQTHSVFLCNQPLLRRERVPPEQSSPAAGPCPAQASRLA